MANPFYELVRTARRTLALAVNRDGRLTVRAPLWTPQSQIDAFLSDKQEWIVRTRARMAMLPPRVTFICLEGVALPYLGRTLTVSLGDVSRVFLVGNTLMVPNTDKATTLAVRWLETQARRELRLRVGMLAERYGFRLPVFRLSRARGRWGSMSARGTLCLNRALILCPPDVMEYVILHELCHMPHPDHSAAFWAHVERLMPGFRTQRAWLKAHGELIFFLP
jgi:predicted metal-dependent hydrolase